MHWIRPVAALILTCLAFAGAAHAIPALPRIDLTEAGDLSAMDREPPEHDEAASESPNADATPRYPLPLSERDRAHLEAQGWDERVGEGRGVWVSIESQRFRIIEGYEIIWQTLCATGERGTGFISGSLQTPLGWHEIGKKVGDDAPFGQVFRARQATNEIWRPGQVVPEDLVLTRLMVLNGLEPGKNQGRNDAGQLVDSRQRHIYIHGTNEEERIGFPSSHGCVRLLNNDVITAYDMLPGGTPVLLTERSMFE